MKKRVLPFVGTMMLLCSTAYADVPLSFTHHGVLKEDEALVNGEREMIITITDEQGQTVAQKELTVEVASGLYTVTVDNIDAAKVIAAKSLTLSINVEGVELSPALQIASVPYAIAAKSADLVNCQGCITPEHLSFNALQDSALPVCKEGQVMRQEGASWVCSDNVNLEEATHTTTLNGRVGINNNGEFVAGGYTYNFVEKMDTDKLPEDIKSCECDGGDTGYECSETFTVTSDNGQQCYDRFGDGNKVYARDSELTPLSEVVVVKDGKIGVGTGAPAAAIHVRTANEDSQAEVVIADNEPAIRLEDLNGQGAIISMAENALKVTTDDENGLNEVLTVNYKGLNVNGNLNAPSLYSQNIITSGMITDSIAGTFKLDKTNLNINYAGSNSQGGAATDLACSNSSGCVSTAEIINSAVTTDKIANSAVTTAKIADSNVTSAKVNFNYAASTSKGGAATDLACSNSSGCISTAEIVNSAVTVAKIADSNVTSAKIADNAVTTAKINDSAVTTAKIANNTIKLEDLDTTSVFPVIAHGRLSMNCPSCTSTDCSGAATVISTGTNLHGVSYTYNASNNVFYFTFNNGKSYSNYYYTIIAPNMTNSSIGPKSFSLSPVFTPGSSGAYTFNFIVVAP